MVRFRASRFSNLKPNQDALLPDYDSSWIEFDPNDPDALCLGKTWKDVWQADEARDFAHRMNSKYIARYVTKFEITSITESYSTIAIILCVVIITCILVPQVLQIVSALFFPASRPPPTPPSPLPVPKSKKRLYIYHFRDTARRSYE